MNSPTTEDIKRALEYRPQSVLAQAYTEAIEALRELREGAKEYLDYIEQFDVFNDADYEMSRLGTIDANLKGSMVHAGHLLAKAPKEQEG